jgi:hypothetical protein
MTIKQPLAKPNVLVPSLQEMPVKTAMKAVKRSNLDFFGTHPLLKRTVQKNIRVFFLLAAVLAFGCNTPTDKVAKAREDVDLATSDLDEAMVQYQAEVDSFKAEVNREMVANQKEMAIIKARLKKNFSSQSRQYENDLQQLEQKQQTLEAKLNNYEANERDGWASFKAELSADMKNLGEALKEFAKRK